MVKCTHCGGASSSQSIVAAYEADGLGAPFKVVLEHAVKVGKCAKCGNVLGTYIPDMKGLFHAVVFSRALEPRKLSGPEVRFMRKAMGWKAKDLAKHLGISAEYLSHCESGRKAMALTTEKLFRIYALLRTPDKAALGELDLSELFDLIKIETIWDAGKALVFHFVRRPIVIEPVTEGDEKWRKEPARQEAT
jgi:transcriptional regulator with XRE-family HTH domain